MTAAAAATAAGARDTTRLEPLVGFFLGPLNASKWRWQHWQGLETRHVSSRWYVILFYFIFILFTNVYFRVEMQQGREMGLGIKGGLETRL